MATTVIDQLIVKLGLDPRDFTKGEKEVAASLLRTKKMVQDVSGGMNDAVRDAADGIGGSFGKIAKRATALFLIFKGLSIATKFVLEASRATRQLGNDARNYDIAAAKLRNFQNIAEMMGGSAEDATKTIAGLQKAIFNLTFNGQMSDQLVMLARLGVKFQDATGHARDFKDVYLDTVEAIKQAQNNGTMTEGEAFQFLSQAGFDPALARAALGGRGEAEAALGRQEARRQVSGADVAAAVANEQAITSAGQAKDAAGVLAQAKASPFITRVAGGVEHTINLGSGQEDFAQTWAAWTQAVEPATQALGDLADKARGAGDALAGAIHRMASGRAAFNGVIQGAAKKFGLDPEILAGVLNTESHFNPNAVNPRTGAAGIAQFMPATAAARGFTAGQDPDRDIYEAARYIAELRQHFVKSGMAPDAAMDNALMAYNSGERRVRTSSMMTPGGTPLSGETLAYPGQVYDYAEGARSGGTGGGTSNVDIGEVNVYTQATDADGMADGARAALDRKLTASHAEQGMQ